MHRFRIVDGGWNALRLESSGKAIAIGALRQPDGVLRPDRGATGRQARQGDDIAEAARVALGDLIARGDLVLEYFQLLDQDSRLHRIKAAGEPEPDIIVFVRSLAVNADAAQDCCEFGIVGEDRAAVAKTAERFCRKATGRGCKAKRSDAPALVAGAKTLCGVVKNKQALACRYRADRIVVGALPEQID